MEYTKIDRRGIGYRRAFYVKCDICGYMVEGWTESEAINFAFKCGIRYDEANSIVACKDCQGTYNIEDYK